MIKQYNGWPEHNAVFKIFCYYEHMFFLMDEVTGNFGTVIFHGVDEMDETATETQLSNVKESSLAPGHLRRPSISFAESKLANPRYFFTLYFSHCIFWISLKFYMLFSKISF